MTSCVAIATVGSALASIYTSSRLVHSTARRGHLPAIFARINPRTLTPVNALLLQLVCMCGYILIGTYESLIRMCGAITWVFYGLCAVAVLVLRKREKRLERPYKVILLFTLRLMSVGTGVFYMGISTNDDNVAKCDCLETARRYVVWIADLDEWIHCLDGRTAKGRKCRRFIYSKCN